MTVLYLFDIDGTLLEARGSGRDAFDAVFAEHHGIADASRGIRYGGKTDPAIIDEIYVARLGRPATANEREAFLSAYLPRLGLGVLASLTPPEDEIVYSDDVVTPFDLDRDVKDVDLVGISVETSTALRAYEIARHFKERGRTVVMGGVHPTLLPDEVLGHADAIVVGQAEGSWQRLIEDFKAGTLKKVYAQDRPALGEVTVDRSILKGKRYLPIRLIEYGWGCPFKCEFCDIPVYFNGRYDVRPLDRVVRVDLPCSPCNRIRQPPARCVGHIPDCLTLVSTAAVLQAALDVLDAVSSGRRTARNAGA